MSMETQRVKEMMNQEIFESICTILFILGFSKDNFQLAS